jgi:antitoxin component of MazEF toxin-antitoxin module
MTTKWTAELQEDPETKELLLPIPTDLLAQMGWSEGTDLWWVVEDEKIIIKAKDETESSKQK